MSANEPRMDIHPLRGLEDEFEFVRELGRGGSSVVYLAIERELEREVAIKTIHPLFASDPDAAARLEREARTLARLEHPNIVTFYGVRRLADGGMAMVMQYVRGERLKDRIRTVGRLPAEEARRILADVSRALGHAHRHHVVHRDIKPENIYLDGELGIARLSDFGIARAWDQDASLTQAGLTIGTPAYMAPEQIDGLALDGRSDLYSLGLVGWEMLSGQRPWDGFNLYGIIYRQKHEALPPIYSLRPDVPEALCKSIETALEKDPARRWPTAEAFLASLGDQRLDATSVPRADVGVTSPRPEVAPRRAAAPAPVAPVNDDAPTIPYRPAEVEAEAAPAAGTGLAATGTGLAEGALGIAASLHGAPGADGPATEDFARAQEAPGASPQAVAPSGGRAAEEPASVGANAASDAPDIRALVPELVGDPAAPPADRPPALSTPDLSVWTPSVTFEREPLPFGQGALPALPGAAPAESDEAWPTTRERPRAGDLVETGFGAFDLVPAAAGTVPELLDRVRGALLSQVAPAPAKLAVHMRDRRRRLAAAVIVLGLALGSGIGAISLLHHRGATPATVAAPTSTSARRGTTADRLRATSPDLASGSGHAAAQLAALGSVSLPAPPVIAPPDVPGPSASAPQVKLLGTPLAPTYSAPGTSGTPVPLAPAVEAPATTRTAPVPTPAAPDMESAPTFTPFAVAPRLLNKDRIAGMLSRVARERGTSGHIVVWIFVSQNGIPQKTQVKESSGNAALDSAALEVAASMRFSPALNGDQHIPVWVAMPIDVTSR